MPARLILLPGWGFGPATLQPLYESLGELAPWLEVTVMPLPGLDEPDAWLDALDLELPRGAWLAGWSLGGMLAAQLAFRRGRDCPGLITLASNPCFRVRENWPCAMPAEVFDTFCEAFFMDADETLKRFSLLCSRGGFDPRTLARQLQVTRSQAPPEVLAAGLSLLASLDNRGALRGYRGRQLHLFAGQDALVPSEAAGRLAQLLPEAGVKTVEQASHGLPLERPEEVAQLMIAGIGGAR
ncbi:alpha/beta fold hydrolase [Stutzerimonas tarimensis]|uniref:Alpha/beta fold hydrolase n=1 Tax=Stutzerimonas tarimensis TaxID=1507735 RepID=A0ABV7T822_9GAMM